MIKMHQVAMVCAVVFLVISTPVIAASFTNLWAGGLAQEVSADGSVVVGGMSGAAVRWQNDGTITNIGGGEAFSVSGDGSMIVGRNSSNEAFLWTMSGGMVGLGDLPGGDLFSTAVSMTPDGSVIVGQGSNSVGNEPVMWTETIGPTGLGHLAGGERSGGASDVSADGSVISGFSGTSNGNGTEAIIWTAPTGIVGLGHLPGGGALGNANAISADGLVLAGLSDSANATIREAFRWTAIGGMIGLGDLPGGSFDSLALDMSADGSTIVGRGNTVLGSEAFIWDEANGMRNLREVLTDDYGLDLSGWRLENASSISADGSVIVGWGIGPSGGTEAWMANISAVPVPSAVWLFSSGLLGLIGIFRRNKFV